MRIPRIAIFMQCESNIVSCETLKTLFGLSSITDKCRSCQSGMYVGAALPPLSKSDRCC